MARAADRLILHVDVDAFFASVEQLLTPSLRDRPVIVGSGCIASCSYEARRFGLHAGMSLRDAKRACPTAVVLEGQYETYRCFAEHVWRVCRRYTCGLETWLDEAYGDATGMPAIYGDPLTLGRKLQKDVRDEVQLPVSVGLARNRMLAKLASSSAKPRGVAWVPPGRERQVLDPLPVEKLPGVGRKTRQRLADVNISTVGQLRTLPRPVLRCMFGRRGEVLYDRCRGEDVDFRPIPPHAKDESTGAVRMPRTISRETTFHQPQCDPHHIRGMLSYLTGRAMRALRQANLTTARVELTIRYDDWKQFAAARSLPHATQADDDVLTAILALLARLHRRRVALRHVGIVLSKLARKTRQLSLFDDPAKAKRLGELYDALDEIRDRWGYAAVVNGESANLLGKLQQNDYGFILRTPSLTK